MEGDLRQQKRDDVKAEDGVMPLQPKEHHGVPTATRTRKRQGMDFPQETLERAWPCQHLHFKLRLQNSHSHFKPLNL